MRIYSVALVAVAALLSSVDTAEGQAVTYSSAVRSLDNLQNAIPSTRLLRRNEEDGEERAGLTDLANAAATKIKGGWQKFVNVDKAEAQLATQAKVSLDSLSSSSNLKVLAEQVKQFNSKNMFKKVTVIGTLTARFGDDALAKALVTAEKSATDLTFKGQIQVLRQDQLKRWLDSGKSTKDVFNLLKFGDDGIKTFASRKLEVLGDYVTLFNKNNPETTTLAATLMNGFGGEYKFAPILKQAKLNRGTLANAKKIEKELLENWQKVGQSPSNVFQWLKLYDDVDYAFNADNLNAFFKYVQDYNRNSKTPKSMIDILTTSYRQDVVVTKLMEARKDPLRKLVAKNLQRAQLEEWLNSGKTADDVFKLMRFEGAADVIASPKLATLKAYIKYIQAKQGGDVTLIKTLTDNLGDRKLALALEQATAKSSLATQAGKLQEEQFAYFAANKVKPASFLRKVFKVSDDTATDVQKAIAAKFKTFSESHSPTTA